jgi:LacI family transcriptional regulator
VKWVETMPRSTIRDVAAHASLSVSTVNRALHEPDKVREETLQAVLAAAETVGFYGVGSIKESVRSARPKVRIGIQLLQSNRVLYRNLSQALQEAAKAVRDHEVFLHISHLDELSPQNVSDELNKLAANADIIGVVSTEHPLVAQTIEDLSARGIKCFAIISELTAQCNVGFVGIDAWKVGRTAGWAFDNLCKAPGKIGILVGSHRYRNQGTNESGFRSYFREHPRGFELLEARSTFETTSIAHEVTEELLQQHPDLMGLYVSGGGISGACAALRQSGRATEIVTVGYDLTDVTRAGLMDGTINLLISHPIQAMARETIAAMIRAHDGGTHFPPQSIALPFEIYTPENI